MKVCLITGATSGIGRAAALQLAAAGVRCVLTGRNRQRGERLASRIARKNREAGAEFIGADLSRTSEVRGLAGRVREQFSRLDILINNAGARFDTQEETPEAIERTFATNHLGHFLLTALLLDHLLAAPSARVVVTGSSAHVGASAGADWCGSGKLWDRRAAYSQSKLANILFAYELARRTAGTAITSNAMDPGGVASRFGRNNGLKAWLRHLAYYALKGQLISPRKGSDTIVYLATDESLRGCSGKYFRQRTEIRSSPASYDESAARRLWEISRSLVSLKDDMKEYSEQACRIALE